MLNRKLFCPAALLLLFLGLSLMPLRNTFAAPVQGMEYSQLWGKATTVVIGTVESTQDAKNWESKKEDSWVPVQTTFHLRLALKGRVNGDRITVLHERPSDQQKQKMEIDGRDWVQFNPDKKHEYLIFLKLDSEGNYEPVSCPGCLASNPFIFLQPYHISNER